MLYAYVGSSFGPRINNALSEWIIPLKFFPLKSVRIDDYLKPALLNFPGKTNRSLSLMKTSCFFPPCLLIFVHLKLKNNLPNNLIHRRMCPPSEFIHIPSM